MWNRWRFLLRPLVLMISIAAVEPTLTNWPTNAEVLVGQTVRLNCSSSDPYYVNWEHIPVGGTSKNYVYLGGSMINPYHKRFSIEKVTPNAYNLVISFVELGDSGRYRCIDREGQGEQREAELTVLESPPFCASEEVIGDNSCGIEKEESVKLSCDIHYSGNLAPSIYCPSLNVTETVKNEEKSNQRLVSYDLRITTQQQETLQSSHICSTRLSTIPSSSFHFNISSVINSSEHRILNQPTNVTCISNSTEQCSHTWTTGDGAIVSFNQTMEIKSPGRYTCNANCPIKGISCNVTCVVVVYSQEDTKLTAKLTAVVIVVLLSMAIAVAVAVLFILRKNKQTRSLKTRTNQHNGHVTLEVSEKGFDLKCHQDEEKTFPDGINSDCENSDALLRTKPRVEILSEKCHGS